MWMVRRKMCCCGCLNPVMDRFSESRGETCRGRSNVQSLAIARRACSQARRGISLQPHGPFIRLICGTLLAPDVDQKARDQSVRDPTTRGWRKVEASSLVGRIQGPRRTVSNLAGASISHCNDVLDADRVCGNQDETHWVLGERTCACGIIF